jgi:hypothetical protein
MFFGSIDFSQMNYIVGISFLILIISFICCIAFNLLELTAPSIIEIILGMVSLLGIISWFFSLFFTIDKSYNLGIEQSKSNIQQALNDNYKNIENFKISDELEGVFSNEDKAYEFYISDNILYVKDIIRGNNNITAIEGKSY